jgi:hypothetical protein
MGVMGFGPGRCQATSLKRPPPLSSYCPQPIGQVDNCAVVLYCTVLYTVSNAGRKAPKNWMKLNKELENKYERKRL